MLLNQSKRLRVILHPKSEEYNIHSLKTCNLRGFRPA